MEQAYRRGLLFCVDLFYPREPGHAHTIEIGLTDVRAADPIRVTYDFDRDGWSILQANRNVDAGDPDQWYEVAFTKAWALTPNPFKE